MKLVIIRGLPGAGKSTLAKKICEQHNFEPHFYEEADKYMVDDKGDYDFNPKRLNYCHSTCLAQTIGNLTEYGFAVVANTFTTRKEILPYLADFEDLNPLVDLGREVVIVDVKSQYKSIHGVPEDKMEQMRNRWYELDLQEVRTCFPRLNISHVVVQ